MQHQFPNAKSCVVGGESGDAALDAGDAGYVALDPGDAGNKPIIQGKMKNLT